MLIPILLLISLARAETVLEGDWIRVMDGCEDLPAEQIAQLPDNGGGNRISRGEKLSFHGDKFRSEMAPPARCSPDFVPNGPELKMAQEFCASGTNTGNFSVEPTFFTLHATSETGLNPWGSATTTYDYTIYNGSVLFVSPAEPDGSCNGARKRIYFIRVPLG